MLELFEIVTMLSLENQPIFLTRDFSIVAYHLNGLTSRHTFTRDRGPLSAFVDSVVAKKLPIDVVGGTAVYSDKRRYEGYPWPYIGHVQVEGVSRGQWNS
ncbi:MAG: hypothetical protein ACREDR_13850 [Blastocatellia bacterium]